MKFTLAILSLVCCGCLAAEEKLQKRSVGFDGVLGTSYGLPIDTSISSHTHTHTTSVIEKPVIVSAPTITTTKVISPAVISSSILPSTYPSFGSSYPSLGSSYPSLGTSYPSLGSFGWPSTYGYGSSFGWPSTYGKTYSNFGKFYPSFGKTYSSGYGWPASTFTKSYYPSSPIYKTYRWWKERIFYIINNPYIMWF